MLYKLSCKGLSKKKENESYNDLLCVQGRCFDLPNYAKQSSADKVHGLQHNLEIGIMETVRFLIHYGLHFLFPILVAYIFFRKKWKLVSLVFLSTMLVDLDHLFAEQIFDANRCSINFHPLHSYYAILVYALGLFWKKTRTISLGLIFHMLTDWQDCFWIH